MKWSMLVVMVIGLISLAGCGGGGGGTILPPHPGADQWNVNQIGNVLQIAYGSGVDFPQYAALHTDSGYFRLINSRTAGWGTSVIVTPSFWEQTNSTTWEQVASPGIIRDVKIYQDKLYAITSQELFVSHDNAQSWDTIPIWNTIPIGGDTGALNAIDIDQDKIYIACRNGIIASENLDGNFSWSLNWTWDGCDDVDMQNGFGWAAIPMWGSLSGPMRKTPDSPWWILRRGEGIPWASMSMEHAMVDPIDPYNIAYLDIFVTTDSGGHWRNIFSVPSYITILDGVSTVFFYNKYSQDNCLTFNPLGINAAVMTSNQDKLFAFCRWPDASRGVYAGTIGLWRNIGLQDKDITALCASDERLFAFDRTRVVYRLDLTQVQSVYRQGAPIMAIWRVDGDLLKIHFSGNVYGLGTDGEITIFPPENNEMTANVTVNTTGNINLTDKPNEAFKPMILSSMHISDAQWDCSESFIGLATNPIPSEGWLVPSAIANTLFGLKGGSSEWKQNAPTVTITLDSPMPITGWITPSSNPNDDNVSMWPASDTVLRSWDYTITAKSE